jgi:hypothetical protein
MSRFSWSRLERGTRIGVGVVLVPLLSLAPFLAYSGVAVMNFSADWASSAGSSTLAVLVGLGSFVAYFLIVVGVTLLLGGFVGSAVQRVLSRFRGRVA